jgi:predicted amidophosphoribosyltransferase
MPATALRRLAALAAPPRCGACGSACSADRVLCGGCEAELHAASPLLDRSLPGIELSVAAAAYSACAREIAHALKFGRRLALAGVAAEAILRACQSEDLSGAIVPVPPAPWRWRWRGFDPAEEIALALAERTGLEYRACLRRSSGPRQVGRSRSARLADPPRARLRGMAPREALLVDDVRTTGATLTACAAALRAGGCSRIVALTLAHSR